MLSPCGHCVQRDRAGCKVESHSSTEIALNYRLGIMLVASHLISFHMYNTLQGSCYHSYSIREETDTAKKASNWFKVSQVLEQGCETLYSRAHALSYILCCSLNVLWYTQSSVYHSKRVVIFLKPEMLVFLYCCTLILPKDMSQLPRMSKNLTRVWLVNGLFPIRPCDRENSDYPKDVHVLIPQIGKCIMLHGKGDLRLRWN